MKTCQKCGEKATIILSYSAYCKKHFLEVLIKRIRKNLIGTFDFNKTYLILKTKETELAKALLTKVYRGRLILQETNKFTEGMIIPTSLEVETKRFLDSFLENKEYEIKKAIYPLRVILREELSEAAKIMGISYEVEPHPLDEIESHHPGTKFATLKSLEEYEKNNEFSE
ncbi:MAG: hypothetical protein ACMXX9_00825 [Candidatus Woesearchaeota archaeon]